MSGSDLGALPVAVQRLLLKFRERLQETLGDDLVGIYFAGSVAFPGFVPDRVDLDFQAVVADELSEASMAALQDMHRLLVGEYRYAEHLDGFYLPLAKAKDVSVPSGLVGVGGEALRTGLEDEAWALHREHVHRGAVLVLSGPDPRTVYPPATWPEIAEALRGERRFIRDHLRHYPFYCVLNLCRLMYTWETRTVAVSKVAAAAWALESLPTEWHPLVQSALRAYRLEDEEADLERLREGVEPFYAFASARLDAAGKASAPG
ncbi:MAG: DUF4111 domain-containing protein [Thermoplasmata archaeon]|nr:DUF4111 domain-containing protein [Thermoplasmata archaeon]